MNERIEGPEAYDDITPKSEGDSVSANPDTMHESLEEDGEKESYMARAAWQSLEKALWYEKRRIHWEKKAEDFPERGLRAAFVTASYYRSLAADALYLEEHYRKLADEKAERAGKKYDKRHS